MTSTGFTLNPNDLSPSEKKYTGGTKTNFKTLLGKYRKISPYSDDHSCSSFHRSWGTYNLNNWSVGSCCEREDYYCIEYHSDYYRTFFLFYYTARFMDHRIKKIGNNFHLCIQTLRFLILRTLVRFIPVRSFHTNIIVLSYFKKISIFMVILFSLFCSFSLVNGADVLPQPDPMGLPFESIVGDATFPIVKVIKETIKYIGILAILAISWGGLQFLTSIGNDEKVKHAKHTIIYALVGVILSVMAYRIVDIINSLQI